MAGRPAAALLGVLAFPLFLALPRPELLARERPPTPPLEHVLPLDSNHQRGFSSPFSFEVKETLRSEAGLTVFQLTRFSPDGGRTALVAKKDEDAWRLHVLKRVGDYRPTGQTGEAARLDVQCLKIPAETGEALYRLWREGLFGARYSEFEHSPPGRPQYYISLFNLDDLGDPRRVRVMEGRFADALPAAPPGDIQLLFELALEAVENGPGHERADRLRRGARRLVSMGEADHAAWRERASQAAERRIDDGGEALRAVRAEYFRWVAE